MRSPKSLLTQELYLLWWMGRLVKERFERGGWAKIYDGEVADNVNCIFSRVVDKQTSKQAKGPAWMPALGYGVLLPRWG